MIAYLKEENNVLREQLGEKRIKFTDSQRRRLARKGKLVGRLGLVALGCIVTPDTNLRWYRQLAAAKYDGSKRRVRAQSPLTSEEPKPERLRGAVRSQYKIRVAEQAHLAW